MLPSLSSGAATRVTSAARVSSGPAVHDVRPAVAAKSAKRPDPAPYAARATFPRATSGVALLGSGARQRAGGTPVWAESRGGGRVAVTVLAHQKATDAGMDGVLFTAA